MPFPDAEHAIVTEVKVRDYLLNPESPSWRPQGNAVRVHRLHHRQLARFG